MNIIITDIIGINIFVIPIVPNDVQIKQSTDNKEEDTLRGCINVVQHQKLRTVSWGSFFPVNKNYSFINERARENGWDYVTFLNRMRTLRLPIRIICTSQERFLPVLNMLATIDEFDISEDNVHDIKYNIQLKEFPDTAIRFLGRILETINFGARIINGQINVDNLARAGLFLLNGDTDNAVRSIQN